jgi:hypothetical protein
MRDVPKRRRRYQQARNATVLLGESSNAVRRTSMPDETHLLVLLTANKLVGFIKMDAVDKGSPTFLALSN